MTTITGFADKLEQLQNSVLERCARIEAIKVTAVDQHQHVLQTANDQHQNSLQMMNTAFEVFITSMDAHLAALKELLGE
jgi:hypothetical protein